MNWVGGFPIRNELWTLHSSFLKNYLQHLKVEMMIISLGHECAASTIVF